MLNATLSLPYAWLVVVPVLLVLVSVDRAVHAVCALSVGEQLSLGRGSYRGTSRQIEHLRG
jgi:hypothetical protein